jgi:NAD(P)H-quinone oxidoreductase subunit 5
VGGAFGVTFGEQPALIAAGAVVAIAVTQLVLQAAALAGGSAFALRALGLSALVSSAYFALHSAFEFVLAGSVLPLRAADGGYQTALAVAVVAVFLGLLAVQELLRSSVRSPRIEALYLHLYNGLYIDVYLTRILQRLWPGPSPTPLVTARSHGGWS